MDALLPIMLALIAAPTDPAAQGNDVVVNGQRPERQICRRVEALTGSHVSRRRVCMTAARWRASEDSSTDDAIDSLGVMTGLAESPGTVLGRGGGGGGRAPGPRN